METENSSHEASASLTPRGVAIGLILACAPAVAIAAIFEMWLGHRHDYTGHFLAGYGTTLALGAFCLRILPADGYARGAMVGVVPFCLACIALGAIAESTAFRLAKFDEIDFFNQSIGAVLASLVLLSHVDDAKPTQARLICAMVAGIAFLAAGGRYAVA